MRGKRTITGRGGKWERGNGKRIFVEPKRIPIVVVVVVVVVGLEAFASKFTVSIHVLLCRAFDCTGTNIDHQKIYDAPAVVLFRSCYVYFDLSFNFFFFFFFVTFHCPTFGSGLFVRYCSTAETGFLYWRIDSVTYENCCWYVHQYDYFISTFSPIYDIDINCSLNCSVEWILWEDFHVFIREQNRGFRDSNCWHSLMFKAFDGVCVCLLRQSWIQQINLFIFYFYHPCGSCEILSNMSIKNRASIN